MNKGHEQHETIEEFRSRLYSYPEIQQFNRTISASKEETNVAKSERKKVAQWYTDDNDTRYRTKAARGRKSDNEKKIAALQHVLKNEKTYLERLMKTREDYKKESQAHKGYAIVAKNKRWKERVREEHRAMNRRIRDQRFKISDIEKQIRELGN
jgi:erythromycin esterase-like protein